MIGQVGSGGWIQRQLAAHDVSLPPSPWTAVVCGGPSDLGRWCFPHSVPQTPPGTGFLSGPFGAPSSEPSEYLSSPGPESTLFSPVLSISAPKWFSNDKKIV